MINVYLDDMRPCPKGFVLARNASECIALLEDCEIDILSLDHDLGLDEPTGYDVAKYMVERGLFARNIYLHSSSAIGRSKMFQLLYKHKPEGVQVHTFPMPDDILQKAEKSANKKDL